MKQLILLFAVTIAIGLLSNTLKAQNSLGFERAIFIELGGAQPDTATITVQSGYAWKITGAAAENGDIFMNGAKIYDYGNNKGEYPLWLPTGSYFLSKSGLTSKALISGIEFKIIP